MSEFDIKKTDFGVLPDGKQVSLYKVSNGKISFSVTDYGCTITSILLPKKDKDGEYDDIVMGYDNLNDYINSSTCFGALVGRFANRIKDASFSLKGNTYHLDKNDGKNMLHGGFFRYEHQFWTAKEIINEDFCGISFSRKSSFEEQGFPGNLDITISYKLNKKNEIILEYSAVSDADTVINITNHSYFNLSGDFSKNVLDEKLELAFDAYLEVNDELIPTGKIIDVEGTPFDFRKEKLLSKDFAAVKGSDVNGGYDHCFCFKDCKEKKSWTCDVKKVAVLHDEKTNRKMSVWTNLVGMQLYTSNFIDNEKGRNGAVYMKHGGVCLETQCYPDSPNREAFPSCVLTKGEKYNACTKFCFDI
ncbi:MAG: galactose mutarotase [Treponema sp.]|nr:galactose mutarotase [Treponema sp.]